MRIFRDIDNIGRIEKPVVTIGSFDGVHEGHRTILRLVNAEAKRRGGESVVITFDPHPRAILEGDHGVRLLNSIAEKAALLEKESVDNLIITEFTRELSLLSAEEFILYLIDRLRMDTLMVGYNHHLGRNKEGDFEHLAELAGKYGFNLVRMPRLTLDDNKISSSVIRNLIMAGDTDKAARYLGYPYTVLGTVDIKGRFTIDEPLKLLPPAGRYIVTAEQVGGSIDILLDIDDKGNLILNNKKLLTPGKITLKFRTFAEI